MTKLPSRSEFARFDAGPEEVLVENILDRIIWDRHGPDWRQAMLHEKEASRKKSKFTEDFNKFYSPNLTQKCEHPAMQPISVRELDQEFNKFIRVGGQPAFGYPLIRFETSNSGTLTDRDARQKKQPSPMPPAQLHERFKRGRQTPESEGTIHQK